MSTRLGNTMECFKHLIGVISKDDDYYGKRRQIADFVGLSDASIQRWHSGENDPIGEGLIKLRFYLEHLGYGVSELDSLDEEIRNAARVFGFSLMSIEDICDWIGIKSENRNSSLLAVFRGVRSLSSEKCKQLVEMYELHREELAVKQAQTPRIIQFTQAGRSGSESRNEAPPVVTTQTTARASVPTQANKKGAQVQSADVVIESFACLVQAMIPLASLLDSDSFSAEERNRMRQQVGQNGVFRLSNLLNRLCGETARREINSK